MYSDASSIIQNFLNELNNCRSSDTALQIENKYTNNSRYLEYINFPVFNHYLANWHKNHGDSDKQINLLIKGTESWESDEDIEDDIIWNSYYIDSVGQMFAMLYLDFYDFLGEEKNKYSSLKYSIMFLSRQIELYPESSHDSYDSIWKVLNKKPELTSMIIKEYLNTDLSIDILTLASLFYQSKAFLNTRDSNPRNMDRYLETKMIAADLFAQINEDSLFNKKIKDYNISEVADMGLALIIKIYKGILEDFKMDKINSDK